uniref:Uncharacterized protein n=1 Tax=Rhizophora mucronata TaxID=61149 RepID=A0A2P2M668_RHIMU
MLKRENIHFSTQSWTNYKVSSDAKPSSLSSSYKGSRRKTLLDLNEKSHSTKP